MDIQKIVKARLRELKMTQYRLAKDAGMTRQGLWAYLNGRSDINGKTLDKVLAVLGLEITPRRERTRATKRD
jgi:transcriptional regulator with XRE-family HTH domain